MEARQVSSPTMPASRQSTVSSTEQTSSSPTPSSFRDHLHSTPLHDPLFLFNRDAGSFQDRLVALSTPSGPNQGSMSHHCYPQTLHSLKSDSMSLRSYMASSMTQSHLNHGPDSVMSFDHSAPSLVSKVSTAANSSVKTDLASFFEGMPQLQDVGEGILEIRENIHEHPRLECSFFFLGCSYASYDEEEWKTHCLSHFFGEDPPRTVQCPLCDHFKYTAIKGHDAWDARMDHMRLHHSYGQTLKTARPDFDLFRHLWNKRLIDNADYKELSGGNHTLSRPYEQPYSVTHRQENRRRAGIGRARERRNRP